MSFSIVFFNGLPLMAGRERAHLHLRLSFESVLLSVLRRGEWTLVFWWVCHPPRHVRRCLETFQSVMDACEINYPSEKERLFHPLCAFSPTRGLRGHSEIVVGIFDDCGWATRYKGKITRRGDVVR